MKSTIFLDPDFNFLLLENEESDTPGETKLFINVHTSAAANQRFDIAVAGAAPITIYLPSSASVNFELTSNFWADDAATEITPANADGTGATLSINFPKSFDTSAALNYVNDTEFEIAAQSEAFADGIASSGTAGASGGNSTGGTVFDFVETIRNIGFRLLDEPSNVNAYFDEDAQEVQIKWTDPADISTNEPVPCEWAGTIVVRKEGSAPLHKWDGALIIDSTTRDQYASTGLIDNTIELDKTYYYGIFPYYVHLDDAVNPIKHYRYTKCISITTASGPIPIIYNFDYKGNTVQTFTARQEGNYLLEVWGASGGHGTFSQQYSKHSLGGYSRGIIQLAKNDKLYIFVGGAGEQPKTGGGSVLGGINGGGSSGAGYYTYYFSGGGGGGATHMAKTNKGALVNYDQHRDEVILVAGGGGGSAGASWGLESYPQGANCGGGFKGNDGYTPNIGTGYPYGGTQNSGYYFGQGQNGGFGTSGSAAGEGRGGGGGGWYGGFARDGVSGNNNNACGGGGSGYINTGLLSEAYMVGYYVTSSETPETYTKTTDQYSETAESEKAKQGNGYARITFLQE